MATKASQTTYVRDEYRPSYDYSPTPAQVMRTTLLNRVSWSAVFAGVVIAFVTQLIMNLIGLGIGFATIDTVSGSGVSAYEFSWAGALWWTLAGILAAYLGGFAAGRLAGEPKISTSGWHGLVSWATSILLIAMFISTAAGAGLNMGGPFGVVMDQESAVVSPDAGTASPETGITTAPDAGITTAPRTATAPPTVVVDSDSIALAALASAIALVLGALAAWFGGCAGTVSSSSSRMDGEDRIVSTH